jgi:hypothetical protein
VLQVGLHWNLLGLIVNCNHHYVKYVMVKQFAYPHFPFAKDILFASFEVTAILPLFVTYCYFIGANYPYFQAIWIMFCQ